MKYYADVNNYYLSEYLDCIDLDHITSSWFFYDKSEEFRLAELLDVRGNVFSFLWEYSDATLLEKMDKWKRAFKRNNIRIPVDTEYRSEDCLSLDNRVYLDIIETNFDVADEIFKNFSAFNIGRNLTQFIVDESIHLTDLDLHFFEADSPLIRFKNCIKMINLKWLNAIVLNGYHHRGDVIKLFIHKKGDHFLPEKVRLEYDIFENTYVVKSFNW
ncbi:hypothetical protein [Chryseobacterium sp.]|uniref:hypothetical protein n=1 Tax=Chryseobacterium sp. TaxID=1871047 RepID=UPI0025B9ADD3|nr:hypothetical protein [Chryseobacterium sp.]MBV8327801.1 hypothetical protein [Chryseobacterium sp.]